MGRSGRVVVSLIALFDSAVGPLDPLRARRIAEVIVPEDDTDEGVRDLEWEGAIAGIGSVGDDEDATFVSWFGPPEASQDVEALPSPPSHAYRVAYFGAPETALDAIAERFRKDVAALFSALDARRCLADGSDRALWAWRENGTPWLTLHERMACKRPWSVTRDRRLPGGGHAHIAWRSPFETPPHEAGPRAVVGPLQNRS